MAWRWLWRFRRIQQTELVLKSKNEFRRRDFCTCSSQGKTDLQTVTDTGLIPFCNSEQDLDEARRLYEQMKELGLTVSPFSYQALIDGYCKFGSPEETLGVVDEMKQAGLAPDVRAYTSLIASFAKANLLDEAYKTFQALRDEKVVELEAGLYSSMVWLFCQANRPKDGELVLQMMKEDQKVADSISCNVVISAYERAGLYSDAIRLVENMKRPLGQTTYTLALNAHLKAGRLEHFNRVFKEMVSAGMYGDANTLETAINVYASGNKFLDAEWLYRRLSGSSVHLTLKAYNKLMEVFINAGNYAMVDRVHREMRRVAAPDATTRRWLLTAYLKAGSFRSAVELYEESVRENDDTQLDQASSQLLVLAFLKAERYFEAMKVAVQMRKGGMSLESQVYDAVVDGMLLVDKPT